MPLTRQSVRTLRALTPFMAAIVAPLVGCSLLSDDTVEEPAVIIFPPDTARVVAPDTVTRDVPFTAEVTTFGGGCTREVARTTVRTTAGVTEIAPFNRRHTDGDCLADIRFLTHRAEVRLRDPGAQILRIVGTEYRGSNRPATPAVLERRVIVR